MVEAKDLYTGISLVAMDSILKYFDSFEDFVENSRNYNHKVLSVVHIPLKEPVPVYCLTVENHPYLCHYCFSFFRVILSPLIWSG